MRSFWRAISGVPSVGTVVGHCEQTALVDVPVVVEQRVGDRPCLVDPPRFAGRVGELDERLGERGEIGGDSAMTRPGLALRMPAAVPAPVLSAQLAEEELCCLPRGVDPLWPPEHDTGLGEGGDSESVPFGDDLVVEARARSPGARVEERLTRLVDVVGSLEAAPSVQTVGDRTALEVPLRR